MVCFLIQFDVCVPLLFYLKPYIRLPEVSKLTTIITIIHYNSMMYAFVYA